jgi:hypothetical protein
MLTFLKIFIVVLLVVLLAHALVAWLRPDVMPGFSFLPGDIKYESPGGNVRVYFPIVTSIVLSVVLTLILSLFRSFFGR